MSPSSNLSTAELLAVPASTRFETRLFYAVAAAFFGIFVLWGSLARLNAGAIASGEVIPAGRVKTIQHLEGGIVEAILVREGERVKAGSELLRLDDTKARAELGIAEAERASMEALVARLEAERDGLPYRPSPEAAAAPAVMAQVRLFDARQQALDKEVAGLNTRLAGLRREVAAWETKRASLATLRANADEESKLNRRLYEQNFISKPRLLQLESQRADSAARISENGVEIARARQRIADTEIAIAKLRNDRLNGLLEELRRAQDAAATAREHVAVARDRLARTVVVAPQDGVVNGLKYATVGGVVPPGGALLDVVPAAEQLVVEARVGPDDIDVVETGRDARVRLTAYKARSHISLAGKVVQVSGSTFRDERTGQPYYKARIEIGPDELAKVEHGLLMPGMLAQVEVDAGERSAISYLFDPVMDSMGRAFKES